MIEVVLAHHCAVGVKRCCRHLHGVGVEAGSLLDLGCFISEGLAFLKNLRVGVRGLRGIENDAGAELRVSGRNGDGKGQGEDRMLRLFST